MYGFYNYYPLTILDEDMSGYIISSYDVAYIPMTIVCPIILQKYQRQRKLLIGISILMSGISCLLLGPAPFL